MNIKKYAPWNWFKDEEQHVPVQNIPRHQSPADPVNHLHNEIDRLFNEAFRGFPTRSFFADFEGRNQTPKLAPFTLKPSLDIKDDKESYTITTEIPGVTRDDVEIEINERALAIRGEKRQENKEEKENYHCIERSYGSFERVLALPRDANPSNIDATFKDGVLTIRIERQAAEAANTEGRKIEVKAAA